MADHLPECVDNDKVLWTVAFSDVHYQLKGCICDRLRACEARVTTPSHYHDLGYTAGVQAARDAVAGLPTRGGPYSGYTVSRDGALAAIDALRGEQA